MKGHHHRSVVFRTVRLAGSANVVFFFGTLIVLGLFVMGNYQEFMDQSQRLLLQLVFLLSLLCAATGLFYLVSLIIWMARRRHILALRVLYGMVATTVGAAGTLGIGVLQALMRST